MLSGRTAHLSLRKKHSEQTETEEEQLERGGAKTDEEEEELQIFVLELGGVNLPPAADPAGEGGEVSGGQLRDAASSEQK
ncbi:Hypothetical predicted protein [Xyrichtys novacula]|uniref:Uncharacterized protein n=1 Tax=Xyrichtys novacula TaxID=13765 RepID=A0AAV1FEY2_XYRNO|nr:Hypothetical predicted protein [Xyrichtys novacula]